MIYMTCGFKRMNSKLNSMSHNNRTPYPTKHLRGPPHGQGGHHRRQASIEVTLKLSQVFSACSKGLFVYGNRFEREKWCTHTITHLHYTNTHTLGLWWCACSPRCLLCTLHTLRGGGHTAAPVVSHSWICAPRCHTFKRGDGVILSLCKVSGPIVDPMLRRGWHENVWC